VSRENAESEVKRFNEYFCSLSDEQRHEYYGNTPSSIALYERCLFCGGSYKNFRNANPGDCPNGVTMSPIIKRDE
jgi:hypothetical protein